MNLEILWQYVYGRHNETRDLNCHLLELASLKQVTSEPIVRYSDENGANGLIADWEARRFWEPQQMALFDQRRNLEDLF